MRDPQTFAADFVTAISEGTGDSESSWMALHTFQVIDQTVVMDWATWVGKNLGEMAITSTNLISVCLGPSGTLHPKDWLFQTAWGHYVMGHCPYTAKVEAASAALLGMTLVKLTPEDWQQIAAHMNHTPVAIEPPVQRQEAT